MRLMKKRAALAMTLGITGAMASQAVAQFVISNSVTVSSYSQLTTNNSLGQSVNYNTISISTPGTYPTEANGSSPGAMIGTVTGLNTQYGVNNQSAFEFDSTYGFRIIGENTQASNGTLSTYVTGENVSGQVIGYSTRESSSSATAYLGLDAWISTTSGGTANTGTFGPTFLNPTVSTTVVGIATRASLNFNGSGTFTGSSTAGTEYTYNGGTFTGTFMATTPGLVDAAGDVVGTNSRYEGDITTTPSTSAGTVSFYEASGGGSLSGTEIGLINNIGNYYNLTPTLTTANATIAGQGTTTMAYYSNSVKAANSAGYIVGISNAYTGPTVPSGTGTTSLGNDAWEYSGAGVGTVGTLSEIGGLNFTGLGTTSISSTIGSITYNATVASTAITGLNSSTFYAGTGSLSTTPSTFTYGYIPGSGALGTFSAATAGSASAATTDNAEVQVHRGTSVAVLNDSGQVGLAATYWINNYNYSNSTYVYGSGTDAYVYTPPTAPATTGTYAQVGLTTASWPANAGTMSIAVGSTSFVNVIGARNSAIIALNDAGQVAGTSQVYVGAGTSSYFNSGTASFYASPNATFTAYTPVQIGLYNTGTVTTANQGAFTTGIHVSQYTGSYGNQYVYNDVPSLMNKSGEVAGTSLRYNSASSSAVGSDAWLYDPKNGGSTFVIDAAAEETNTYVGVNINYLSDNGVVVGQIATGTGTNSSTGTTGFSAFIWSEANPNVLIPLTTNTTGLSNNNLQSIANGYFADLTGYNLLATAVSKNINSNEQADTLVSLTPEPGSLSILGIGAIAMLRRRRNRPTPSIAYSAAAN